MLTIYISLLGCDPESGRAIRQSLLSSGQKGEMMKHLLLLLHCVNFMVLTFCYQIQGNTILLPGDGGNPSSFVATAFKIYQRLQANSSQVEELEESGGETETSEMPPLIPDIDPEKSLHSGKNKA